jgi:CTP synthase
MSTKYIFVTGGVVSGIGKGITAATIGCLLKARGLRVRNQKFDPYINVDPGLMSPTQHGEVFITDDGAETDLDIGHYERFTDVSLDIESDITSGMIYRAVIQREREGGYLGTTVQVVPHIINEIKEHVFRFSREDQPDVMITEIGGTVGDMESLPYLEAIRQVSYQVGHENVLFVHVTLIPYLRKAGEIKTKPTQHSVQKLLSLGIQPDVLVCRSEMPLDDQVRQKIALYCNVKADCVIQNLDVASVYQLPLMLEEEGLARAVCRKLKLGQNEPDLSDWQLLILKHRAAMHKINVALVGKYVSLHDAYLSVVEALKHAGIEKGCEVAIRWVSAEDTERDGAEEYLAGADAIIVPGGFGPRGMSGMMAAAEYARTRQIPFLGIGLGMQMAVVEFARHVAGLADAHSDEVETDCRTIFALPVKANAITTDSTCQPAPEERHMRRGSCNCVIMEGTRMARAYGLTQVAERHHHRREFCNQYRELLIRAGLIIAGTSPDGALVEAIELAGHPWFVGVQFHPEFKSRPTRPHPLFVAFVGAALQRQPQDRLCNP